MVSGVNHQAKPVLSQHGQHRSLPNQLRFVNDYYLDVKHFLFAADITTEKLGWKEDFRRSKRLPKKKQEFILQFLDTVLESSQEKQKA